MDNHAIDNLLDAIQEALADDNYPAANDLCLLTMVRLLADIDKKLNKSNRIALAELQTGA